MRNDRLNNKTEVTSDHAWRSYVSDYYYQDERLSKHLLRLRLATWNMADRCKNLTITDHTTGISKTTFNNPWDIQEDA